jgi:GntR family transcriptional regulator
MTSFQLEPGPVPLHHQVYLDLRRGLDGGEWSAGDQLPPERELAVRYGCSLITVRRALSDLAREQRLERSRGRGTFVMRTRIDRDLSAPPGFTEEMRSRGLEPETRVITARRQRTGRLAAEALGIGAGAAIVYLERLRLASGEPLLLEQVSLPADRFPGLLETDLETQSLYDILSDRYQTHIARTRETLEPVLLSEATARLLGGPSRGLAMLVEGIAYATDGSPVEYGRTYVRGDRTRYYVERVVARPGRRAADTALPLLAGWRHDGMGGPAGTASREEEADQREAAIPGARSG